MSEGAGDGAVARGGGAARPAHRQGEGADRQVRGAPERIPVRRLLRRRERAGVGGDRSGEHAKVPRAQTPGDGPECVSAAEGAQDARNAFSDKPKKTSSNKDNEKVKIDPTKSDDSVTIDTGAGYGDDDEDEDF